MFDISLICDISNFKPVGQCLWEINKKLSKLSNFRKKFGEKRKFRNQNFSRMDMLVDKKDFRDLLGIFRAKIDTQKLKKKK